MLFEGICIGVIGILIGVVIGIVSIGFVIFVIVKNFVNIFYVNVLLILILFIFVIIVVVVVSMVIILIFVYILVRKVVNILVMECIC